MTAREWLFEARRRLAEAGMPDPETESRWMLDDALDVGTAALRLRLEEVFSGPPLERAQSWLEERLTGRPLQYVQGCTWFMGHRFLVDERVLIPRQDTETLCELAISRIGDGQPDVLDLCTGSGAVGISIALACKGARVYASDISRDALDVARKNGELLGAAVTFLEGDLFAAVQGMRFDLIACNPPYLEAGDMESLQTEVAHEPALALCGGADGLDFYRRVAREAGAFLRPGGLLLLEAGAGQAQAVAGLLGGAKLHPDLSGTHRVVEKRYSK